MNASPLAGAIKAIRKRRGQSMRAFSKSLGLSHSAVSGYESGRIIPSRSMLLLLLPLASEEAEKAPILEALDETPHQLRAWEEQFTVEAERVMQRIRDEIVVNENSPKKRQRLLEVCACLVRADSVPTAITRFLELWLDRGNFPGVREAFEEVVAELCSEVDSLIEKNRGRGTVSPSYIAKKVMMQCPTTEKWFDTGSRMSRSEFRTSDFGELAVFCPHCQMSHRFDKLRARVQ